MDATSKPHNPKGEEGRPVDGSDDSKQHLSSVGHQGRRPSSSVPDGVASPIHPSSLSGGGRSTAPHQVAGEEPGAALINREIASLDWNAEHRLRFTKEQEAVLRQPVDPTLVEIRWDKIVYMPGAWYRKVLNDAFGPGGWRLLPLGRPLADGAEYTMHCALICENHVIAQTWSEFRANQKYAKPTKGTIYESLCTDGISKCGKTLGIAEELWFPSWVRKWIADFAEEVWDKDLNRKIWRRVDDTGSYHIGKPGYDHANEYEKPARAFDEAQAHMDNLASERRLAMARKSDVYAPEADEWEQQEDV